LDGVGIRQSSCSQPESTVNGDLFDISVGYSVPASFCESADDKHILLTPTNTTHRVLLILGLNVCWHVPGLDQVLCVLVICSANKHSSVAQRLLFPQYYCYYLSLIDVS